MSDEARAAGRAQNRLHMAEVKDKSNLNDDDDDDDVADDQHDVLGDEAHDDVNLGERGSVRRGTGSWTCTESTPQG